MGLGDFDTRRITRDQKKTIFRNVGMVSSVEVPGMLSPTLKKLIVLIAGLFLHDGKRNQNRLPTRSRVVAPTLTLTTPQRPVLCDLFLSKFVTHSIGDLMPDRVYSLTEIQDRFAIIDLYDRQLAGAEAFDFDQYDTTFAADARIDLSDFGQPECDYPTYRAWLASLKDVMVEAQRITGGLRLELTGDQARTHVPVACHVTMAIAEQRKLTHTGLFYNDVLERRPEGWRIVRRVEEHAWSGSP